MSLTEKISESEESRPVGEESPTNLPVGVKLRHILRGHRDYVTSVAFDLEGETLASASADKTVKLWEVRSGSLLHTLHEHHKPVLCVAFDRESGMLASGSSDRKVKLWEAGSGKLLRTLKGNQNAVWCVAFHPRGGKLVNGGHGKTVNLWDVGSGRLLGELDGHNPYVESVAFTPDGRALASGGDDYTVKLWDGIDGSPLRTLRGHEAAVASVAFDPCNGQILASGSEDRTVKLWETESGRLLRTLEGHTEPIAGVAFSPDGRILASRDRGYTIRLWSCETWDTVAIISNIGEPSWWIPALAFSPTLPLLASVGSELEPPQANPCRLVYIWELDFEVLLGKKAEVAAAKKSVHHTTSKIVLVGDHSVGKSALGYRMIHGYFREQASTHGQQFWVFPALGKRRPDGTDCEAILWDFAGQPDYRLVHALFLDDADLALVLFDASDLRDPLHGVGFWLKQLRAEPTSCPIILVAAQTDRGISALTPDELNAFCRSHGIAGPITTSALTGVGIAELVERMKSMIPWDDKPATVTTTTFKRIKDYVLGLKEAESDGHGIMVTPEELRGRLEAIDADWRFTDTEMLTAVGHLENYGYVRRLRTSNGELRILLQPQRLNNLASSLVLEARRNPKGLGALEEKRLLASGYDFPEVTDLDEDERGVLLDSAALLFLKHNVCFRETDPLRMEPYLVFPELINLKKPLEEERATADGVAYTVSGPMENVFASLVVLLGYTHTFTRTSQWQNNARYEVGNGLVCGFRQEAERDGELDLVLCFSPQVGLPVRALFQGLFESFLARRNLTVMRYEPVVCSKGHHLNRAVVREAIRQREEHAFCSKCGEKLNLPKLPEPIQLTGEVEAEVDLQRRTAEQRTRFEQAVFQVRAFVSEQKIKPPECFISYSWGVQEHERWVEQRLATDLQKAGIDVTLDRWHNAQIGASVARFVERIEKSDRIVMVGTPLYRHKYENKDSGTGYVVAAEVDVIANRLLGTEAQKQSVLPLLLDGEKMVSLPPLLHGRVHADFRDDSAYFTTAFDLILSLYQLPPNHAAVADLRESLRGPASS